MRRDTPSRPIHLLLVAPSAPPLNSPEAMQVGRFLAALDPTVRVTLVTTPIVRGWEWEDATLAIDRPGLSVITPSLPVHRLTQRVLANHRLAALHIPDADFWLPWFADHVAAQLNDLPDVIYSRSAPFSAALLAQRLKRRLSKPWLMHLSDPWSGSPYRVLSPRRAAADRTLEAGCVADADLISLTTEGQAAYYRSRYPDRAKSIIVTPNMMPLHSSAHMDASSQRPGTTTSGNLTLVHTGALYGSRNPDGLLRALSLLRSRAPELAQRVRVHFIGNMPPEVAARIDTTPECIRRPPVSFEHAKKLQSEASLVMSIEPLATDPLHLHFLMSKVVDYLDSGRPVLALTSPGSLTEAYCRKGYGWAFSPDDVEGIAVFLEGLLKDGETLQRFKAPLPPVELEPHSVTRNVVRHLQLLAHSRSI